MGLPRLPLPNSAGKVVEEACPKRRREPTTETTEKLTDYYVFPHRNARECLRCIWQGKR